MARSFASLLVALAACGGDDAASASDGGGSDAGARCRSAADCDDGLFCTGAETCGATGTCVPAAVPCPATMCDEGLDRCDDGCLTDDGDADGHRSVSCGGDDCDDVDATRFPGNAEVCDAAGHDEDCDPATYGARDGDADGHDDGTCCNGEGAEAVCGDDCDDTRADVYAGLVEACDSRDNDCDGTVDEGVTVALWPDADGDMYGDAAAAPSMGCAEAVSGRVSNDDDCDDDAAGRHPGTSEVCNGVDDDCNGLLDGPAEDVDADGFGDCPGARDDCGPDDATVYPGAPELCDGQLNDCLADRTPTCVGDCRGLSRACRAHVGEDCDADGHLSTTSSCVGGDRAALPRDDCDDADYDVHAAAPEVCNGRDDTCDGVIDGPSCSGTIECGTVDCALASEVCCVTSISPFTTACQADAAPCGNRLECDGPEDCGSGEACCYVSNALVCTPADSCSCQLCHVDAHCTGAACEPFEPLGMSSPYFSCGGC